MDGIGDRVRRIAGALVLVGAVVGLGWVGWRQVAVPAEVVPSEPVEIVTIPAPETPRPSASESEAPSEEPTETPVPSESPSASEGPGGTVLFGGGPATGPWQQLGTVAEITHPDAPSTARYSWANFWTDPEEENQPDELWDQIVREVTAQLVELGEPVDRPAFGGAPGSEPFNSFGGLNNIYVADRVFTASWSAVVQEEEAVVRVYWHYLIAFDGEVLARRSPIEFEEVGGRTFEQNAADNVASLQRWAAGMGFVGCDGCS